MWWRLLFFNPSSHGSEDLATRAFDAVAGAAVVHPGGAGNGPSEQELGNTPGDQQRHGPLLRRRNASQCWEPYGHTSTPREKSPRHLRVVQ